MTRRRLSRRGHYLLTLGVTQFVLGVTYGSTPALTPGRAALLELLPPAVYRPVALIAGTVAVIAALYRPPAIERVAFGLLIVPSLLRAGANLASLFDAYEVAQLTGAVTFALVVRLHLLIAPWPDEPARPIDLEAVNARLEELAAELRQRNAEDRSG